MGQDIHIYAQHLKNGVWEVIKPADDDVRSTFDKYRFNVLRNHFLNITLCGRFDSPQVANYLHRLPKSKSAARLPKGTCKEIKNKKQRGKGNYHSYHYILLSDLLHIPNQNINFCDDLSYYEYKSWKKTFPSPEPFVSHKFDSFYYSNKRVDEAHLIKLMNLENFKSEKDDYNVYASCKWVLTPNECFGIKFINLIKKLKKLDKNPENIMIIAWLDN